mgnify:CR=1 FL=1
MQRFRQEEKKIQFEYPKTASTGRSLFDPIPAAAPPVQKRSFAIPEHHNTRQSIIDQVQDPVATKAVQTKETTPERRQRLIKEITVEAKRLSRELPTKLVKGFMDFVIDRINNTTTSELIHLGTGAFIASVLAYYGYLPTQKQF